MGRSSSDSICAGSVRQRFRPTDLARCTDTDDNWRSRAICRAYRYTRTGDPGCVADSAEEREGCGA
jgi:hypothetical protein